MEVYYFTVIIQNFVICYAIKYFLKFEHIELYKTKITKNNFCPLPYTIDLLFNTVYVKYWNVDMWIERNSINMNLSSWVRILPSMINYVKTFLK